ncbi:Uncharacterized beta-barrel protein YwiB, DUF1934 family [Amphibacillus marinus]|uniref:Uncharacterized beta-barrel protein YwiB, DUF1934 family n=1 Tax=Amphibacillus marinus TaxID=872970 RepID=A0A1H8MZL0_9BACI|nr:DUF1934 domain-containing protein [Amphibacillus marinus]SEO22703.1 Uncharacterized beta-barrel protein YwiB, DUF1934 family [Amphibacillus marinus]
MQVTKNSVKITLHTEIADQNDQQVTDVKAIADLFERDQQTILTFKEQIADQPDVRTMITITNQRVTIKRSGGVEMNQQFKVNQTTETVYRHAYGAIRIETATESVQYTPLSTTNVGRLKINYTTKLDGEALRNHKLALTIEEDLT